MRSVLASTFAALLTLSVALPAVAQPGATAPGASTAGMPIAGSVAKPAEPVKVAKPAVTPHATGAATVYKRPTAATPTAAGPVTPVVPAPKTN